MDLFEIAKQFFAGGLHLLQENNLEGAEAQFARSLEILPNRASTLNNLAGVKIRLQKFAEAEPLARKAILLDENSPEAWTNLGIVLSKSGRSEEALQAYNRALKSNATFAKAWLGKAEVLLELNRHDDALLASNEAQKLAPHQPEVWQAQSLALKGLERHEEARKAYLASLAKRVAYSPVFIATRRATQKSDTLILSPDPCLDDSLKSFERLHLECPNFPGQLARLLPDDLHFTFVFKGDAASLSAREQIPQPDFVINNCTNAERILANGDLPELIELADSFGVPVVNHPTKAVQTGREATAQLLGNIRGVRVPKTIRFSAEGKTADQLAQEIEAQFNYPLITRTLTSQEGKGMTKVDTREALLTVLASDFSEKFFVTEFVDSRGGKPYYRKIRAAIVQDEIIIVRVDHDTNWKIYARKSDERVAIYRKNAYLHDIERRICLDLATELGPSSVQSLRAIRERIPLDVFGIDFDVDAEGRVVFYEANATMNLFSTARKEVPYPKEADDCLKLAFQRYFTHLLARP